MTEKTRSYRQAHQGPPSVAPPALSSRPDKLLSSTARLVPYGPQGSATGRPRHRCKCSWHGPGPLCSPLLPPPVPNAHHPFPGTSVCVPAVRAVQAPAGRSRAPPGQAHGPTPPTSAPAPGGVHQPRRPPLQPRARHQAQPGPAPHLKPGSAPRLLGAPGPAAPQTPRCPPDARVSQVFTVRLPWWTAHTREPERVRKPRAPPLWPPPLRLKESWEL